jgi:nitroreductase
LLPLVLLPLVLAHRKTTRYTETMNTKILPILGRRSVRKYRAGEPVSHDDVQALLEAAMAAPSAMAQDPWRFLVLRERAALATLADWLPHGKMLNEAALGIVVCGDLARAHCQELSYLLQDCTAAVENLLLAAHLLGLGAVWLGVHPNEDRVAGIRQSFGMPDGILPVAAISIGHPAETPALRTRFNAAYVHAERW